MEIFHHIHTGVCVYGIYAVDGDIAQDCVNLRGVGVVFTPQSCR